MSSVRFLFPKLRLTSQLREAGGVAVADALAAAAANLEELKPQAIITLQSTAADLMTAYQQLPASFDADALRNLYAVSARGVGSGGVAGAPAADEALISLCDLLDYLGISGRWDMEAIGVHVSTLQLLAMGASGHTPSGVGELLAGLKKVTARYADAETSEPAAGAA
jgi:hypothetical protein